MNRTLITILCLLILAACTTTENRRDEVLVGKSLTGLSAGVACAHPIASEIGAKVLKSGGNAVDAAVAVQWALAVCFPEAGNIGGGGFMVMRRADGLATTLDFRERAPFNAFPEMYLDAFGDVVDGISLDTRLGAGVPGSVMGIYKMHSQFGSLPMEDLINPAIDLALNGFQVTATQALRLNENRDLFIERNSFPTAFVKQTYWEADDTLVQTDLGNTLTRIRDHGPLDFYTGETAQMLLAEMADGKGLISAEDLKRYDAKWRNPITFSFDEYDVISMGPPSSGGIALEQMIKMAKIMEVDSIEHNSTEYLHFNTEIQRRVYADRSKHLGDPEFHQVPYDLLTNPDYLAKRLENFRYRATPSSLVGPGVFAPAKESMETTHLSVVDAEGNAVSITTTINGLYGSRIVVQDAGFLLNNEMDDFSSKPGVPNDYGLIGGAANAIEGGKRMLSSMTPTIVEKNDSLFLVVGSPGGSTIITSVYQTIANCAFFDMDLEEAIAAPKFHSQWIPDKLFIEEGRFPERTLELLQSKGHEIGTFNSLGRVDAIKVAADGTLEVCGDPRGDDAAAGY
jgi:gamma-glutamyltranspeptidase/glutathione hydrolase